MTRWKMAEVKEENVDNEERKKGKRLKRLWMAESICPSAICSEGAMA